MGQHPRISAAIALLRRRRTCAGVRQAPESWSSISAGTGRAEPVWCSNAAQMAAWAVGEGLRTGRRPGAMAHY